MVCLCAASVSGRQTDKQKLSFMSFDDFTLLYINKTLYYALSKSIAVHTQLRRLGKAYFEQFKIK